MNAKKIRSDELSKLGLTPIESAADVFPALVEIEGECDRWMSELGELEKLGDERLALFVEVWREKVEIMRDRARACQRVLPSAAQRPALAIVKG